MLALEVEVDVVDWIRNEIRNNYQMYLIDYNLEEIFFHFIAIKNANQINTRAL